MSPRPRSIGEIYAEGTKDRLHGRALTAFEIRVQAEALRKSVAGQEQVSAATVQTLAGLVEDLAAIVDSLDTGFVRMRVEPKSREEMIDPEAEEARAQRSRY